MFPFCKMEIIIVMTPQAYLVGKKQFLCIVPGMNEHHDKLAATVMTKQQ